MAKINNITSYPISTPVTGSDIVIGSITGSGGDTANFLLSGIATYITGQISLANVCSVGSTTATTMDIADTLTLSKPTGTGLQVDADANIDGTLEVAQTATFQLGVMIDNAGLAVMGSGGIIVGSTSGITSFGPISGISLNSTGGLLVSGTSLLGAIDAAGVADIADTLTLSKATGTGLQVDSDANIDGTLDVTGVTTLTGALDANSTADIADTLTLSKATGTGLQVDANANIDGSLTVNSVAVFTDAGSSISAAGLISTAGNILALGTVACSFLATDPAGAPLSASATGTTGSIVADANYIYVCTATDTWKRVAIATW